ncbi:MAG TPA: hypothetical protein VI260_13820 [Blastocatellia bacterium]|jgi:hypothetical protein
MSGGAKQWSGQMGAPVLSVNREIDEEFHLSLFICHLILIIAGGDLDSMSNVHRAISGPMTNEQ